MPPPALHSELGGGRRSIAEFCSTETGSLPLLPGLTRARWAGRNSRDLQTEPHRRLGGAAAAGRRRRFLFTRSGRAATMAAAAGAAKRARRWSILPLLPALAGARETGREATDLQTDRH